LHNFPTLIQRRSFAIPFGHWISKSITEQTNDDINISSAKAIECLKRNSRFAQEFPGELQFGKVDPNTIQIHYNSVSFEFPLNASQKVGKVRVTAEGDSMGVRLRHITVLKDEKPVLDLSRFD